MFGKAFFEISILILAILVLTFIFFDDIWGIITSLTGDTSDYFNDMTFPSDGS